MDLLDMEAKAIAHHDMDMSAINFGNDHVMTVPLVEVHSVSIETRHHIPKKPSKQHVIYGKISVVNTRDGSEFLPLFDKDYDNPEFIQSKASLLLNHSSRNPILASKYTTLRVHLFDKIANNMIVAKKDIVLNKKGYKRLEHCDVEIDNEEDGITFARVHYTIFLYSVTATVDVVYISKKDYPPSGGVVYPRRISDDQCSYVVSSRSDIVANVSGSVSVLGPVDGYGKLFESGNKPALIRLFESGNKPVQVRSGCYIPLSRSFVVVPVYISSLAIDINLSRYEGDTLKTIARGVSHSNPQDLYSTEDLVGEDGDCIRVMVDWNICGNEMIGEEICQMMNSEVKPSLIRVPKRFYDVHLVEVFSVVVYRKDFMPFKFYGTVKAAEDFYNRFYLFRGKKDCPQFCPESHALAELKPSNEVCLRMFDTVMIWVDLKDAETEAEISNGFVAIDYCLFRSLLGGRFCSVVRGEQGFAAVHYAVLSDAVIVKLDLKLYAGDLSGYVNGKVVARYSTYDYSTEYEKQCYSNILFDRDDKDSPQDIKNGSSLQLLKSKVGLDRSMSLIIEADLSISATQGGAVTSLKDTVELNFEDESCARARLGGDDFGCYMEIQAKLEFPSDF